MDIEALSNKLSWMPSWMAKFLEKRMKKVGAIQKTIDKETAAMIEELEASLKPYSEEFETFGQLPKEGRSKEAILQDMQEFNKREESRWEEGYVSGAVYHGDKDHIDFLNQVYAMNSQSNPLHSDLWPSATKFEAEIISMTANMLGADSLKDQMGSKTHFGSLEVCGSVTSGGTESILLAMKAYRDWAKETKGITRPEMILPVTAHAAFDKAAMYFGIKQVRIPLTDEYNVDVEKVKRAVNSNTIVIVGSAPAFPHGIMDDIKALSEIALSNRIGFHTDACLGGFVLPWAEKLGYKVPPFDFRLPGVTSMSVDTHKYGYAAKGTSVVLYRSPELRHFQYYTTPDWPGGLYFSPTFAGSRPGALIAACWAALLSVGEEGYLKATKSILETAEKIKKGISEIPELQVMGDPLFVVAIKSEDLNIYRVSDELTKKHWNLNGLHHPACIHIAITQRHTQEGVSERFIADLKEAVAEVKANPDAEGGFAPVYGMAANIPFKGMVSDILNKYMDVIYKV